MTATISGEIGLEDKTISNDKAKLSQKKSSNSIHYTAHKQMMTPDTGGLPHVGDRQEIGIVMFISLLCLIIALIVRKYTKIKALPKG